MVEGMSSTLSNPIGEIDRLKVLTRDIADKLRSHRDMLALRSMTLPAGSLEKLNEVADHLLSLSNQFDNDSVELQQLRGLARTTELINSTLNLDLMLDEVVDTVIMLTGAERGYIVLRDIDSGELLFRVARDNKQHKLTEKEFIVSRTIVERVATQGELLITNNAAEQEDLSTIASVIGFVLRSILCVPLLRKGVVTGVIYADNRARQSLFGESEKRLVIAFANQAAVAIENARLFEGVRSTLAEITAMKDFREDVFTSIASGVITTDGADNITTINEAAARILGLRREALVGQSLWSVLPPIYEGFDQVVANVREHNREQTLEVDPVLEHRGQVSLNLRLSPLRDAAQVTRGVAIVLDDLTDLRQRQAQLSAVQRYLPPQMVANIKTIDELELGGVEREISILYCDVRGFTSFSETLQPELLMETINKYLTVSSEAIHGYEGIVDKYMGDAVVGLFNTQLNPHTDHAIRAVAAALRIVEDVKKLHLDLIDNHRLLYGIGVHTGPAVLGNVGSPRRKEFTAIGSSLQIAKLLQENANGGEVVISQETYDLVRPFVVAEPTLPRKLKESQDVMPLYRVLQLVE